MKVDGHRILMGKHNKIIGYPGTGKTTLLIKILKKIQKRYPDKKVTYCSYTNDAVNEARERLGEGGNVKFGTIHSLAKRMAGIKGKVIHSDYRYCKSCGCPDILYRFAEKYCSWYYDDEVELSMEKPRYTVKIDGLWALNKGLMGPAFDVDLHFTLASLVFANWGHRFKEKNYVLEKLANLLRQMSISNHSLLTNMDEIYDFIEEWQVFKKENNYFEFNDLLVHGLDHELDTDILIVDEFQDLSALQYALIEHWASVDTVIVAGDYNQSIYGFQGGSPDFLLDFESDNKVVLNHTYRLPQKVLEAAKEVLQDQHGFDDVYSERDDGEVTRLDIKKVNLDQLQRDHGSVFVLARTNYQLKQLKERLGFREKVTDYDYGLYLILYQKLQENAAKEEFIRIIDRVRDKELILTALDNRWKPERLRSGVEFKTIHSSKGLEADVVVLFDQTERKGNFSEEERRVWYVGLTRSRGDVILFTEKMNKRTEYLKMLNPILTKFQIN